MAYELYSHMLKHIYWGSYTIAQINDDTAALKTKKNNSSS